MIRLLRVTGESLSPDFQDGDFVFILKIPFLFKLINAGDTVVFEHSPVGTLIKKVDQINPKDGSIYVLGDHQFSVDSRQIGWIPKQNVIGKVIWHVKKP